MRYLFYLSLFSSTVSAQPVLFQKDSSVIKRITDLPSYEPFDSKKAYRQVKTPFVYIISQDDMYNIFDWNTAVKYYNFDFENNHILGLQQCSQCMTFCRHEEGMKECHRNLCNREWVWVIRENNKAFTEIPSKTLPGHISDDLPAGRKSFFGDTIINQASDLGKAAWFTSGHGDCYATFKYRMYVDKYHPVLLMKEWNYWGGCRAGGSWNFTVSFSMPPGISYKQKSIVLAERYKD